MNEKIHKYILTDGEKIYDTKYLTESEARPLIEQYQPDDSMWWERFLNVPW